MEIYVLCCWGGDMGSAEPYVTLWPSEAAARKFHRTLGPTSDRGAQWFIELHRIDPKGLAALEYVSIDSGAEVSQ